MSVTHRKSREQQKTAGWTFPTLPFAFTCYGNLPETFGKLYRIGFAILGAPASSKATMMTELFESEQAA